MYLLFKINEIQLFEFAIAIDSSSERLRNISLNV